ncbi:MAG TPA: DUF1501 domain-containing protein, partial [Pirellulaceae bacterium]|nr:DUF1501 domain-containing protein [Pirellulaceae bacterium]
RGITEMNNIACHSADHFSRRTLLQAASASGLLWLTPVAELLAQADQKAASGKPARSIIVLWLQGGPSQLETFDPHPNSAVAFGSTAIDTAVKGIQLGQGFDQLAELMPHVSLVRSLVSKEGDHERATYNVKTGYAPDPTLVHPSIGAILCHQQTDQVEIPRHISILPGAWPGRGGFLGDNYDAFRVGDPLGPIPDVTARVPKPRFDERLKHLNLLEDSFARGRLKNLDQGKTLHRTSINAATKMMSSDQLKAFNVQDAPQNQRDAYGDSAFGRGCLAALRLITAGVRCVEVMLDGWDTHIRNHELQLARVQTLDPAFAQLIRDLKERGLFDSTIILCAGEFGRTPKLNPTGGRDHWPHGFSVALSGGGFRGGVAIGETSPELHDGQPNVERDVKRPVRIEDLHTTMLTALGIEAHREINTPVGRPMKLSKGEVVRELLS